MSLSVDAIQTAHFYLSSQFRLQISKTGPSLETKGLTRTHSKSSENSPSSPPLDVTVKFVSTPASTLSKPWKRAKRCEEAPPITQNCSFLHQSSIPTPPHRISRIPVAAMEMNIAMNTMLA
nr:hypothetical protein MtrunA17_Chr4g0073721 [Ipomoea batatas]